MLLQRPGRPASPYIDVVADAGCLDYIQNETLHKNAYGKAVMVPSEASLANLADYEPGTVAFTAGYAKMWQKAADGTWAVIV